MTARSRANGEGSIFPYRNGFAAYVWVTTPSGKRTRKYVYGKTRDIVHGKWLDLHRQAREGVVSTRVPTVASYMSYWLDEVVRPNLAPQTYAAYESHSRLYVIPGLGGKRLDRLQVRDVQVWLNAVRQTCRCCAQGKDARRPEGKRRCCAVGACCKDYPSAVSIQDIRATLRAALSSAQTDELVAKNVAALAKLPGGRGRKIRKRKTTAWSTEDVRTFLEHSRVTQDRLYAAWVLILVLGLRKGELLGLTWDDVDLDHCELRIAHQLQRVGNQLLHRETKTAESEATLPLPGICVTALAERRRAQAEEAAIAGDAWECSSLVFTSRLGGPIEPRNFNRSFDARLAHLDVPRITPHDARRTCATLLVDLDVHPRIAMRILRHAQFSMTMEVYAKASSAATTAALKRLGESLE